MSSARRKVVPVAVLSAVLLAATGAALRYDDSLRELDERADRNGALPSLYRSFGDDGSIVGSRRVVEDARLGMPDDAAYRIVMGPAQGAFNAEVAPDFLRYYLLPRRESESAPWVICLGCDVSKLGDHFRVLSRDDGIVFGCVR